MSARRLNAIPLLYNNNRAEVGWVEVVMVVPRTDFTEGEGVYAGVFALVKGSIGGTIAVLRKGGARVDRVCRVHGLRYPHTGGASLGCPRYPAALFDSNGF